ncbi:MAG: tail fiber protein [bacterium]|nr:tail fiber protein [bacterium]
MKKQINLKMAALFLIAVLAVMGCEAGLTSNDSSGSGNGEEFSFSDLYSNIATLKEEIACLKNTISGLQGADGSIENNISELSAKTVPVGTVLSFAGDSVPDGWLLCDGSQVSKEEYSSLYSVIGVNWGGDSIIFNLPDLRGRFLRGVDGSAGRDPDAAAGTRENKAGSYQVDAFQGHQHDVDTRLTDSGPLENWFQRTTMHGNNSSSVFIGTDRIISDDSYGTARVATETRPMNAYVNYIIKY